jgi:uncharacterized protein DUF1326
MRRVVTLSALILLIAGTLQAAGPAPKPQWSMNATIIEACSCPMFCQCYFNSQPSAHEGHGAGEHFCKFNNAFKVNRGHYGNVKLDGLKFWVAGDLGGDFSKGQMDWAVLTFDKTMTKEQRAGVAAIVGHIYPVKWNSLTTAEGTIDTWKYDKDSAYAALDGGKSAEVKLKRHPGNTNEPVVIKNLKYWGTLRNDGFVLMPNEVEAYRVGEKAFEFKGTNGFMITFDINSNDVGVTQASMAH